MRHFSGPHATFRIRGALAAFFFALANALACPAIAAAGSEPAAAPVQTQLADGLTLVARKATASPTAALEIWIKCPANGYGSPSPGIARLAALALVEEKAQGSSLRDEARKAGAQIGISIYAESTEIAIVAPAYLSQALLDKLAAQVLHPHLNQPAFDAGRQRLAAQQVASSEMVDQVLRDSLFAHIFSSGPLHDSTYGNPQTLAGLNLNDMSNFVSRAYVPANEIVVAVGDVDASDVVRRIGAAAPPAAAAESVPNSGLAPLGDAPISLTRESLAMGGVAIGWVGPPIEDERAATAMDFLSDFLTHPSDGVVAKAVNALDANTNFSGQFITQRDPGIFFVTASGEQVDPTVMSGTIRDAMKRALGAPLSRADFQRALDAFRAHLLRDMQSPQGLADNYGWYFAQGALAYSPSATGVMLSGDYFDRAASLTPEYVHSVATRYLRARPAVILLRRGPVHISGAAQ